MNTGVSVKVITKSPLPVPPIRWNFLAYEAFSNHKMMFKENSSFLADHCGSIRISLRKTYMYDYLGLIPLPIGKKEEKTLLVIPLPLPVTQLPDHRNYISSIQIPKPGGGFSENYELRDYVPGDDLRQVHWKLTAKTGKIILREPTIPVRKKLVISMDLSGDAHELDRKLGRFLYVSDYFLKKDLPFSFHCNTGRGMEVFYLETPADISLTMEKLLCLPPITVIESSKIESLSFYHIGGEPDEV